MENLYMVVRREENEQDLVGSASQRKKVKKAKKELDKRGGAWYHVQAVAREQRQTKPRGTVYLVN